MNSVISANRSATTPQALFLLVLPAVRNHAQHAFRRLQRFEREEALQEVLVQVYIACVRLTAQGEQARAYPSALARFAIARYREGRRAAQPTCSRDVLSEARRSQPGCQVAHLSSQPEGWQTAVADDSRTPIPDQVSFRLDFPVWLHSLSSRQRRMVRTLTLGYSTGEAARRHRVTAARVSQIRRELRDSWNRFAGDRQLEVTVGSLTG